MNSKNKTQLQRYFVLPDEIQGRTTELSTRMKRYFQLEGESVRVQSNILKRKTKSNFFEIQRDMSRITSK